MPTEHDPLCPSSTPLREGNECLICLCIAEARAEERRHMSALVDKYSERLDRANQTITDLGRVHVTSTGLSGRTDYAQVRFEVEAELRAKVMALPDEHHYGPVGKNRCIKRADVLALLP